MTFAILKGFGKPELKSKKQQTAKRKNLGGRAAKEFQLLDRHNETKEQHLPSRVKADSSFDPLPNTMRVSLCGSVRNGLKKH